MRKPLEENKSGVYLIRNKKTKKLYIGSSVNIKRRLTEHRRNLRNNKHCNSHLQNAWNKYSEDNFEVGSLSYCDIELLESEEQYWLNMTDCTNRKYGYNVDTCAYNSSHKLSEETKEKIRKKAVGRKQTKAAINKRVQATLGQKRPAQSEQMRGRWDQTKKYFGYMVLSDEKKKEVRTKISIATKLYYQDDKNVKGNTTIQVQFSDGTRLKFRSIKKTAEYLEVDKGAITYVLKHTKGYLKKRNVICRIIENK